MFNKSKAFQKGQALPVGLALFMFLGLTSLVLYNTGQTASDKTRIVNTADAAAYSGLLWQARAMNFQAYTNRAMVANQVAMAQAVSLNSWAAYIRETGSNVNDLLGWIPYIGAVTNIIDRIGEMIYRFMDPITKGMLSVVNVINKMIGPAQEAMYYSTFASTPDVVNSVVKANRTIKGLSDNAERDIRWDTAYSVVSAANNLNDWRSLTEKFDKDHVPARRERAAMINQSKDEFTKKRDWKFFNFWIPITPLNWVRVEKQGTTRLIEKNNGYEWKAKDDVSLRTKRYTWRGTKYSELPVGYAESFANSQNGDTFDKSNRWFGNRQKHAQYLGEHLNQEKMGGYDGLQAYRSLSVDVRKSEDKPSLLLRVEIELDTSEVDDSEALGVTGEFRSKVDAPAHVLTSVGSAELYFEKPCIDNACKEEYANGYNPFWDVRLKKTGTAQKMAAYATRMHKFDDSHLPLNRLKKLPSYGSLATPVDDYQEQAKGLYAAINSMESQLQGMVENSDEYRALEAKLNGIKDQINQEIQSVAQQFAFEGISGDDAIDLIVDGLDIELSGTEQAFIAAAVNWDWDESVFDVAESIAGKTVAEMETMVKEKLEEEIAKQLESAVKDILSGLVTNYASNYVGDYAGIALNSETIGNQIGDLAQQEVDKFIDEAAASASSTVQDAIDIDVTNECNIYESVHAAEVEVKAMQDRLKAAREKIIEEFEIELNRVTGDLLAIRAANLDRIAVLYQKIADVKFGGEEGDTIKQGYRNEIEEIRLENAGLTEDRINILTGSLKTISDNATKAEFPDYRLDWRLARKAVEETLQDATLFENDEIGIPEVADALHIPDLTEEDSEDSVQTFTEKPENCA